ncbi:GlsB/YeaQ/YmgE family stress response membrane protein [Hafnia alvei]|uniref:Transglycosylase associated protein n=1 Tax=Hafnia alvei ATCC 51873 TaxID=1002364 RepID=G9Y586_HAFAL|nr:GlsB/YeaQ/YmgE family stress response membrane protein [Hafnia alvei]AJR00217.1 Transglycosylase associated protein [Enterobacteriaceae bacterium bta3-1]EHM43771.1 transglycosylase associated protein [Hafnia alvei ATCC 51873]QQE44024.1 GlsB/YeaQ/YmgE family stress response membrane protein [Hafnia alvei]
MGIISWIILGLIVGILAKWFMPGKDGGSFFMTVILGIAGALVGGYISAFFGLGTVTGFNIGSLIISILGAMLLLFIYRKLKN